MCVLDAGARDCDWGEGIEGEDSEFALRCWRCVCSTAECRRDAGEGTGWDVLLDEGVSGTPKGFRFDFLSSETCSKEG